MIMEGHWVQSVAFDNMEGILDAVGITDAQIRGLILSIKPEIELVSIGDKWEYKLITPHSTRAVTFASGDIVDYVSIVGRPVKAEMLLEGNRLIEIHRDPTNTAADTHITREFNDNQMTTTFQVKDVVAVGKYTKT